MWLFPGLEWPGCKVDHSSPSNAEVKESVKEYIYTPTAPYKLLLFTSILVYKNKHM